MQITVYSCDGFVLVVYPALCWCGWCSNFCQHGWAPGFKRGKSCLPSPQPMVWPTPTAGLVAGCRIVLLVVVVMVVVCGVLNTAKTDNITLLCCLREGSWRRCMITLTTWGKDRKGIFEHFHWVSEKLRYGMTKLVLRGSWGCHHCKSDKGPP